LLLIKAFY